MTNKKIYLLYPKKIGIIAPEIYGHFTEHIGGVFYDGLWVGKDSEIPNINGFRKEIVEKLKQIKAPVLRWPGGCFAETYDWRDGIGKNRPTRLNWWTKWDGRYESNEVGTHEFMDLCEMTGAKAYFAANITSVNALHIQRWMDYCMSPKGSTTLAKEREENGHPEPFDIPFWGVGNENWGGGGNMTEEFYASEFRRLNMIMKTAFPGREYIICGSDGEDYAWTDGVMRGVKTAHYKPELQGFAMHYYTGLGADKVNDNPVDFGKDGWNRIIKKAANIENVIKRNWNIIKGHGLACEPKLIVDEWGCWHRDGSGPSQGYNLFEQQSTIRDAAVAALSLNVFNNHCDKVRMANIAQLCNNLHALFLAGGKNCITTPTFHVFDMYKEHQNGQCIETLVTDNGEIEKSVSVSASVKDGKTTVTLVNLSCEEDTEITFASLEGIIPQKATGKLLYNENMCAHNTFDNPDAVVPQNVEIDVSKPFVLKKTSILSIEF